MTDVSESINEAVDLAAESRLNTIVAACVALTATFMALCNVKDGNVVQNMAVLQSQEVDTWSYYQAKSTKQSLAESVLDQLIITKDTTTSPSPEAQKILAGKIQEYGEKVKRYETEKEEIKAKAGGLQKDYDALNIHDDQFDMSEACLSIAIALLGVTALTQKRWLLAIALIFTIFGFILGIAGFAGWDLHPDFLARLLT
ncbi:MAG TPA: DUF4337 domain-containing protein [Thermoanaerobaculia bacterium]|nr:DUF4337 domain-containing protein [Thermoanaerobaculia bacterium]